jgi:hypothetical protein
MEKWNIWMYAERAYMLEDDIDMSSVLNKLKTRNNN